MIAALGVACGASAPAPPPGAFAASSASAPPSPRASTPVPHAAASDDAVDCNESRCVFGRVTDAAKLTLDRMQRGDVRFEFRGDGDALQTITRLPWIRRLTVRDQPIADVTPIAYLVDLRELSLAKLPKVRSLVALRTLARLERLTIVDVDADPSPLFDLPSLRVLSLSARLSPDVADALRKRRPDLELHFVPSSP